MNPISHVHSLGKKSPEVQPDGMICCSVMDACAEKVHGIDDGKHWIYGLQVSWLPFVSMPLYYTPNHHPNILEICGIP